MVGPDAAVIAQDWWGTLKRAGLAVTTVSLHQLYLLHQRSERHNFYMVE